MSSSKDRPTSVLDRPDEPQPSPTAVVVDRPEPQGRPATPLPRGWGSHEDRRTTLWFLAGFVLLALYAGVFVILGEVAWS